MTKPTDPAFLGVDVEFVTRAKINTLARSWGIPPGEIVDTAIKAAWPILSGAKNRVSVEAALEMVTVDLEEKPS